MGIPELRAQHQAAEQLISEPRFFCAGQMVIVADRATNAARIGIR